MQGPTASPMGGTGPSHLFSGRANLAESATIPEAIPQQSLQPWLKHSTPPSRSYDRNKLSPIVSPLKMEDSLVSWLAIATDGCILHVRLHVYA